MNSVTFKSDKTVTWQLCAALAVVTLFLYLPVTGHQFINFDDPAYVTENAQVLRGLTLQNLSWAFRTCTSSNWHPLTWLSHMTDVQLYGTSPRGHHFTSVLFHVGTTLLLFLLLLRMTGARWRSLLVAALFALHPLHVESVAWVAERKDVLSGFLGVLTLYLYGGYVQHRTGFRYVVTLSCFVAGLLAKPMLVTLPLLMLLLDWWPLRREGLLSRVKEKIPFFLCAAASGLITLYAQQRGGAVQGLSETPLLLRLENALTAYVSYLGKTVWPRDLAILYPLPAHIPLWRAGGALLILLTLSAVVVRSRRRFPYLTVGWGWFILSLLPVIGIIQVGSQAMADRYTYLPLIGVFLAAVWGITDLTEHLPQRRVVRTALSGAVLVGIASLTWQQLGYWQDNRTLYQHTVSVTTGNYLIHNNLGNAYAVAGDLDNALRSYQNSLQCNPDYADAYINMGIALQMKGYLGAALQNLQWSLQLKPANATAYYQLGLVYGGMGDVAGSVQAFERALQLKPDYADAANNLGITYARRGDYPRAQQVFRQLLQLEPGNADAHFNAGLLFDRSGNPAAAIVEYEAALRLDPGHEKARSTLRMALGSRSR